ncbi:zona pellucida glycoprotein 3f, tandem duplicate 2 [Salminus brasiliensis]|uniref:zona pellucida glycoprotein 3f, tandem duplicate 2 n=1 Tax=Salminus brasiliensis TaxID=930266 RepID=UPI003B830AF8
MPFLRQCFVLLATAVLVLSSEDIHIECESETVKVTWKVNKEMAERPARLLLGNCLPSEFTPAAYGGGLAVFHSRLSECRFREKRTQRKLIYENRLTFRPLPKPNPAAFTYNVTCSYPRPEWIHTFLVPSTGVLEGRGRLIFHMGLLNDDLSGPAVSNSIPLGSFIHIWAAVEQQAHQPLILYLEECVASTTLTLEPESLMYPIITNKGCLVDGKVGSSKFLPRYHSSSIFLQLQAFSFALEQEVYIHCKLVVWDPETPNEKKKACNYNKALGGWELLDDPSKSNLCNCCDYGCGWREKRGLHSDFHGSVVLGPLIITASSSSD